MVGVVCSAVPGDEGQGLRSPAPGVISRFQNDDPRSSERTNPSRVRSKGREALSGSSLRRERARAAAKAASIEGTIGASAPPAIATSTIPSRIIRAASPTEWAPEAHAVETASVGPVIPCFRAMNPAAMLTSDMGAAKGETPLNPRERRPETFSSQVPIPPRLDPMTTAVRRARRGVSLIRLSRRASSAAAAA